MNIAMPAWTLGALIALVVLIVCIVVALVDVSGAPSNLTLALIAALAVARLT